MLLNCTIPKPIRDRGIKVIEAGFSDFKPIDSTIPDQRFDSWRAQWQKKTELTNAEYDLEIMREMNHARAQAQREIIYNLSQIFKLPGYTQDAMAIRIFQALGICCSESGYEQTYYPGIPWICSGTFSACSFTQDRDGQPPGDLPPEGWRQES